MRPIVISALTLVAFAHAAGCAPPPPVSSARLAPPPSRAASTEPIHPAPSGVDAWLRSERDAFRRAREEHRPMIIHFEATWCAACKELDRVTFADALVRDASRRFVALRLDATNDDGPDVLRWQKEYALTGLPTVIIVDARGQERARITELVTPAAMLDALAKAR